MRPRLPYIVVRFANTEIHIFLWILGTCQHEIRKPTKAIEQAYYFWG